YRKLGEPGAGYPGTFQDVATAVDTLRGEAVAYDLDLTRVVATGHSARRLLALWAGPRIRIPANTPRERANPPRPRVAVSPARDGTQAGASLTPALPLGLGLGPK